MSKSEITSDLERFDFREIHPRVFIGTASDRYAGWIGQIYSRDRYDRSISRRSHKIGGRSFTEEVLPVESVGEYFEHFSVLELDFTFYQPLLAEDGEPTSAFFALRAYSRYLEPESRVILKVPQAVFARKLRKGKTYIENSRYLDPDLFSQRFYEPASRLLSSNIHGFVFEQEYQRKKERPRPEQAAEEFDRFFNAIPSDPRYHVELRTHSLWTAPVLEVLERHGAGKVLSHWTWLPSLRQQFEHGSRQLNGEKPCIVRLMTPRGMRYEDAYAKAHPFSTLVDGMLDQRMLEDTTWLMESVVTGGGWIYVVVNNRAGGNAPLIAREIARRFLARAA